MLWELPQWHETVQSPVAMKGLSAWTCLRNIFLERFVDIVSFKQSPIVRQIGKFSDPPRREDLAALAFEHGDLDELRRCRFGDYRIQLSADQIRRIQAPIDWSTREARAQANDVLRESCVTV